MSKTRPGVGSLFLNLLGGFQASAPGPDAPLALERKKTRALLAVLALDAGRMLPRGRLSALLWAEQSEEIARHGLRQSLLDLRRAMAGVDVLRADADAIGLDPARVVVDAAAFEAHVARGTPEAVADAVALYSGDLLEGFSLDEPAFEEWLRVERERLRSRMIAALRMLVAQRRDRDVAAAVQAAVRLLTFEPFDESAHRALMRLYAQSGRRGAAMRQYEECVELLARELGIEPEPETRELYRQLLSKRADRASAPATSRRRIEPAGRGDPRLAFRSPAAVPLVGREADVQWLDGLRARANRGLPQLALVLGEAGIGKSRLVSEAALRAQYGRTEILLGRGREGEEVLAFAPWIEALRPALSPDLPDRLAPVTRRDLARLWPELADDQAEVPGGMDDGPRIFEAVAHLLRDFAARHPLVVVIEDLHWCDDMTLRLLRFLPRRLHGQPVLLVGTARPEEAGTSAERSALLESLRLDPACASRTLAPLSRDETTRLFGARLHAGDARIPAALAERVWTLSEGNPFVVLECARAARDRGTEDALRELPEQVRALTTRYLAALSPDASRLADIAAVIGRDFDVGVLRHAAGLSASEVADRVEELVRRRVLRESDERFDFGHDRVRETAYARLLGPRRELLHRQVADALEAVYADDLDAHCAAIGAHYRQAGVWPAACEYLARAGFQAFARGASHEALACFEDVLPALARLSDTQERRTLGVRVRLGANGAFASTGQMDRARHYLHEAEDLAERLPDRRWAGRVAAALGNSYRASGTLDRALHLGQRALEIARQTADRPIEAVARFVLGQTEHNAGNFRVSLDHLTWVLRENPHDAEPAGPAVVRAEARYWVTYSHILLGEFDAALRAIDNALAESDPQVDPLGTQRLLAHLALGKLHNETGEAGAAVEAFEAARAVYRDDCHGNWYWTLALGLGLAYVRAGRTGEGLALLDEAESVARARGANIYPALRLNHLAEAWMLAGRLDEAEQAAEDAVRLAREKGNLPNQVHGHRIVAEVARLRVPVSAERMERRLLAASTLAEQHGTRPAAARCNLRLAWLARRAGRPEWLAYRAAAASLLEEMGGRLRLDATDRDALA